jgi:hypothetical protein
MTPTPVTRGWEETVAFILDKAGQVMGTEADLDPASSDGYGAKG